MLKIHQLQHYQARHGGIPKNRAHLWKVFANLRDRNCCEGVDSGPHLKNEWMKGAFHAVTGGSSF